MENGGTGGGHVLASGKGEVEGHRWRLKPNEKLLLVNQQSIRGVLDLVGVNLNREDGRSVVPLGHGDPSAFETFRTTFTAEDAVVDSIRSGKFNCYPPSVGLPTARRAVAEYLSQDLPYKLSHDDVFLTVGCSQAIEVVVHVFSRPCANILLPRPGFPLYEARTTFCGIEARHFDLLPDQNWEIDLEAVESLADENTVAMVIINPVNPCGNVFSREHLEKVAGVARKLGIVVIADEVYAHLNFGSKPFVPMGAFGSVVPVITMGSISKRWVVPGWRVGWLVTCDPNGILKQSQSHYFGSTALQEMRVASWFQQCFRVLRNPSLATCQHNSVVEAVGNATPSSKVVIQDHAAWVVIDDTISCGHLNAPLLMPLLGTYVVLEMLKLLGNYMGFSQRLSGRANTLLHYSTVDCIKSYLNVSSDPATIMQAAIPKILGETTKDFFNKTAQMLKLTADICYNNLLKIDCISCPHRPEGSMFVMVKLDAFRLDNIKDDMDFCCKLAREESVVVLPGTALGMGGWLRITFAVDPPLLEDGLARMISFCHRHKIN